MDRSSNGKIKLYRNLKVLFYCLGLPLFVLAVIFTATWMFVGEQPFMGSGGSTTVIWLQNQLAGSAMYGVWVALGVWLLVAIVHLIVRKTVKNRRARTMIVAIVALVAMLTPVVVMDIVMPIELEKLEESSPEGVTIASYKTELSELVRKTGGPGGGVVQSFLSQVSSVTSAYHIGYGDSSRTGFADNTSNDPVSYDELYNVDESGMVKNKLSEERILELKKQYGDGSGTDHEFVRIPPNADGKLEIDGVVYENYTSATYSLNVPAGPSGTETTPVTQFRWFKTSRNSEYKEGIYGLARYNSNGMISQGYVFGIDSALELLRQYYYSQMKISELGGGDALYSAILAKAQDLQEEDYSKPGTEKYEIWHNFVKVGEEGGQEADYSLTVGDLKQLLDSVGTHVGANPAIAAILNLLTDQFNVQLSFKVGEGTLTIANVKASDIADNTYGGGVKEGLLIQYAPATGDPINVQLNGGLLDGLGELLDVLLGGVVDTGGLSVGAWLYDLLGKDLILGLNLNKILGLFGLDLSSLFVGVTDTMGTGEVLQTIIMNLLGGLYWYSDPEILPVYDYYAEAAKALAKEDPVAYAACAVTDDDGLNLGDYYAMLDKAVYNGGIHGYMVGSVLIPGTSLIAGDNIGAGTPSSSGLGSYAAVVQLQADLAYKPVYYPLYSVRNLLLTFLPVVLFCLIASGIAAEKEWLLETGQDDVPAKKEKKGKKGKKDEEAAAAPPEDALPDDALPDDALPDDAPVDATPEAAPAGEPSYDDAPVAMPAEDDIPEPSGEEGTALSVQENNGEEVE